MKTSMKSTTMILAATALLVLTSITITAAQGPGHGGKSHHARAERGDMLQKARQRLDLSEEQKTSVKALFESNREAMQADRQTLREAREALRLETQSETFDEAAIRQLSARVHDTETDMAVARASLHNQVMQLLTEEQQAELNEMRAERQDRMKDRRDERRHNPRCDW